LKCSSDMTNQEKNMEATFSFAKLMGMENGYSCRLYC